MRKLILTLFIMLLVLVPTFVISASAASSDQINYFGTTIPCKKDNGFAPDVEKSTFWDKLFEGGLITAVGLNDNDPHKGWNLGSFYVQGYSGTTKSDLNSYDKTTQVYLKNAGDTVTFGFKLEQDIENLNGNKKLVISDDRKIVKDCWVEDPYFKGDIGRGILIVIHTDFQGNQREAYNV